MNKQNEPGVMNQLEVRNLSKHFGGLKAVDQVSFKIKRGTISGLIGPNGSGKTTTLNMISGLFPPTEGDIYLEDKPVHGLGMRQINILGIARTFQQIRLFSQLSCFQNVMVSRHNIEKEHWWEPLLFSRKSRDIEELARQKALYYLDFVGLYELRNDLSKNLSYGNQRKLEIARALATEPRLLLLDEPVAGMNPVESESIMELLSKLLNTGITVILVEHSMNVVMNICSDIVVLDKGKIIAVDAPAGILSNQIVIDAYLGKRGGKI